MMKHLLFFSCLLAALGVNVARAAIVLDDANGDLASADKHIEVPKPKDPLAAPGEKAAAKTDLLRFSNNDTLHGSFLGFDKASGIRWQSLESKEPIVFQTANLAEIRLDSHRLPASAQPPAHAVTLTNDDELPGNLVSLDDKVLLLDTWYAGKLSIPRAMVKGITPLKVSPNTLYQGPTGLEGWTIGQNGNENRKWTYRDGALIATSYGTIGRDVKLPNLASVEFDLISRGNSQMNVCLYTDQLDNISNCYMFQINNNYIYLQRYSRNGSNNLGEQPVQLRGEMMRREKVHFGMRVNKETKTLWLFVNGTMVKQWTDPGEFAGKGTGMIFSAQQDMYVKISNIKATTWDGRLEDSHAAGAKGREDIIKLENQDKVSGKLKSIENGKALFASSYADLTIPLDRVEEINMSSEGADQPKRNANDVRAFFQNRGCVTMLLESWDGKEAVASSLNFGKTAFSPDAFQRLQFNVAQPSPPEDVAGGAIDVEDQ